MPSTRSTTSGAGSGRLPPAAPSVGGRQPFAIAASGKLGLGGRCWLSPISMLPLYLPLSSPPTRLPPPLRSGEGSRLLSQLPGSLGSVGVGARPQPRHIRFSSPGKALSHHPARGPAGNLSRRVPVGQSARFWPSLGHPVPRNCLVRGALTGAIPRLWPGRHFPATPLVSGSMPERREIRPAG